MTSAGNHRKDTIMTKLYHVMRARVSRSGALGPAAPYGEPTTYQEAQETMGNIARTYAKSRWIDDNTLERPHANDLGCAVRIWVEAVEDDGRTARDDARPVTRRAGGMYR